jgi:hypothetical protein
MDKLTKVSQPAALRRAGKRTGDRSGLQKQGLLRATPGRQELFAVVLLFLGILAGVVSALARAMAFHFVPGR